MKRMFSSLNASVIGARLSWPDYAKLAATAGFPGVDVPLDGGMKYGVEPTLTLLRELKLKPASFGFPVEFRKDEAAFQQSMNGLEPAAKFAAAVGCPRMHTWIMPSSETPKAELRATYRARFRAAADVLARHNVRLGLEFIGPLAPRKKFPHEFIWKMGEMVDFAKDCGENVGLLLDAWHWHHAGATVADIHAAGKKRIVHVHINDAAKLPPEQVNDGERLLPGKGVIDLKSFVKALRDVGYPDALSVEVLGQELRKLPAEQAARMTFEAVDAVMKSA